MLLVVLDDDDDVDVLTDFVVVVSKLNASPIVFSIYFEKCLLYLLTLQVLHCTPADCDLIMIDIYSLN